MKTLLLIPPFTQLNTPYPSTAYLKSYLNRQEMEATQADLSLEVILALFSRAGLQELFDVVSKGSGLVRAGQRSSGLPLRRLHPGRDGEHGHHGHGEHHSRSGLT